MGKKKKNQTTLKVTFSLVQTLTREKGHPDKVRRSTESGLRSQFRKWSCCSVFWSLPASLQAYLELCILAPCCFLAGEGCQARVSPSAVSPQPPQGFIRSCLLGFPHWAVSLALNGWRRTHLFPPHRGALRLVALCAYMLARWGSSLGNSEFPYFVCVCM